LTELSATDLSRCLGNNHNSAVNTIVKLEQKNFFGVALETATPKPRPNFLSEPDGLWGGWRDSAAQFLLQHTADEKAQSISDIPGADSGVESAHFSYALLQALYEELARMAKESAEHHHTAEEDFAAYESAQHFAVALPQPRRHPTHTPIPSHRLAQPFQYSFVAFSVCRKYLFMCRLGSAQVLLLRMVFATREQALSGVPSHYAFHPFSQSVKAFLEDLQLLAERFYLAQKRVNLFEVRLLLLEFCGFWRALRHKWQTGNHSNHRHKP